MRPWIKRRNVLISEHCEIVGGSWSFGFDEDISHITYDIANFRIEKRIYILKRYFGDKVKDCSADDNLLFVSSQNLINGNGPRSLPSKNINLGVNRLLLLCVLGFNFDISGP